MVHVFCSISIICKKEDRLTPAICPLILLVVLDVMACPERIYDNDLIVLSVSFDKLVKSLN